MKVAAENFLKAIFVKMQHPIVRAYINPFATSRIVDILWHCYRVRTATNYISHYPAILIVVNH
ncbi:MAG: hypothetical protein NTV22_04000, partial [bacterium]|nr:hypothetical protein [bacterium]